MTFYAGYRRAIARPEFILPAKAGIAIYRPGQPCLDSGLRRNDVLCPLPAGNSQAGNLYCPRKQALPCNVRASPAWIPAFAFAVIPAEAGIQWFLSYIPAAGGNDIKFILLAKAGIAI